jgi:hypothetical protein
LLVTIVTCSKNEDLQGFMAHLGLSLPSLATQKTDCISPDPYPHSSLSILHPTTHNKQLLIVIGLLKNYRKLKADQF